MPHKLHASDWQNNGFCFASLFCWKQSCTWIEEVFFLHLMHFTTPSCSILKRYLTCFSPLHLWCRWGLHSFSFFPNFSHAHAFNFYRGVELYSKAQISAVQQLFGENWCASFAAAQNSMRNWELFDLLLINNHPCTHMQIPVSLTLLSHALPIFNTSTQCTYLSAMWCQ